MHVKEHENTPPLNPLPQGEGKLEGMPSIPLPLMGGGEGEGEQGFSNETLGFAFMAWIL